jgi:predicted molibdopterin-dependent oxidoreductase YjgC
MFKQDLPTVNSVEVILDGESASLPAEVNLAAALLAIGKITSKISSTSHKPCSPHCLMGVCFECLMEIDGVQRQACMTPVRKGMVINRYLEKTEGGNHEQSL